MKPRLLVVTSTFPRWQNDTDPPFVYELSKRLTSAYSVFVHTPCYSGALTREKMSGVQIHRFRYFFSRFEKLAGGRGIIPKLQRNKLYCLLLPIYLIAQFISLFVLVKSIRPAVIHAHWLIPQGLFAVLTRGAHNPRVVVVAHGADVFSMRGFMFKIIKKFVIERVDHVVTVSTSLSKKLISDTKSDIKPMVISMGVDSKMFSPQQKNTAIRERYGIYGPFLLFVGRLTEKKGVRYLIEAMEIVNRIFSDAKLLIVGHGELDEELKFQVRQLGVQNVVLFTGGVPNYQLPQYYATADIFIGPSIQAKGGDTEGFGITFVEAAMSGCLLIGTRVGGIEDIIDEGKTGFLVPPANSGALADTIQHVINNMAQLVHVRDESRRAAIEKFDWDKISKRFLSIS